jgi:hypothetical protein
MRSPTSPAKRNKTASTTSSVAKNSIISTLPGSTTSLGLRPVTNPGQGLGLGSRTPNAQQLRLAGATECRRDGHAERFYGTRAREQLARPGQRVAVGRRAAAEAGGDGTGHVHRLRTPGTSPAPRAAPRCRADLPLQQELLVSFGPRVKAGSEPPPVRARGYSLLAPALGDNKPTLVPPYVMYQPAQ